MRKLVILQLVIAVGLSLYASIFEDYDVMIGLYIIYGILAFPISLLYVLILPYVINLVDLIPPEILEEYYHLLLFFYYLIPVLIIVGMSVVQWRFLGWYYRRFIKVK